MRRSIRMATAIATATLLGLAQTATGSTEALNRAREAALAGRNAEAVRILTPLAAQDAEAARELAAVHAAQGRLATAAALVARALETHGPHRGLERLKQQIETLRNKRSSAPGAHEQASGDKTDGDAQGTAEPSHTTDDNTGADNANETPDDTAESERKAESEQKVKTPKSADADALREHATPERLIEVDEVELQRDGLPGNTEIPSNDRGSPTTTRVLAPTLDAMLTTPTLDEIELRRDGQRHSDEERADTTPSVVSTTDEQRSGAENTAQPTVATPETPDTGNDATRPSTETTSTPQQDEARTGDTAQAEAAPAPPVAPVTVRTAHSPSNEACAIERQATRTIDAGEDVETAITRWAEEDGWNVLVRSEHRWIADVDHSHSGTLGEAIEIAVNGFGRKRPTPFVEMAGGSCTVRLSEHWGL